MNWMGMNTGATLAKPTADKSTNFVTWGGNVYANAYQPHRDEVSGAYVTRISWGDEFTRFYPMGNWSFGGSSGPTDPDTAIFQLTIRRDPDGSIHNDSYEIIPCCVSSDLEAAAAKRDMYNNYQPTPMETGSEEYTRVLSKLDGSFEGPNLKIRKIGK